MKNCDIAIAGAGLAGSTAAAMLGKAGYDVALIDPHDTYPAEFRCEKLDASQVELLRKTGLAEPVLRHATLDGAVTIARNGRYLDTKKSAATASSTTRWSTPSANKSPRACARCAPRSPASPTARIGKSSC